MLSTAAAATLLVERAGARMTLNLSFRGDLKRETRWLAQYGQAACALVAAGLIWSLDPRTARHGLSPAVMLLAAVFGTAAACIAVKKLVGRVRPRCAEAGQFLGPNLEHANYRESFPSSHSACAVAMTVVLCSLYPPAAALFWLLAVTCAGLRYMTDAHWPSDVLAGMALGYGGGMLALHLLGF